MQYLRAASLRCCFSFENRKKLFDIDSRFKFALVVLNRIPEFGGDEATKPFLVRFYLHDAGWLFSQDDSLRYDLTFVEATGGSHLSFVELQSEADLRTARTCHDSLATFGSFCSDASLRFSVQADVTRDAGRFVGWGQATGAALPLDEGKTFHQYTDRWLWPPRYCVPLERLADKCDWIDRARHYRVAFRGIASSTNERTSILTLLPAGSVVANSAPVDAAPAQRTNAAALTLVAVMNSFAADWCLRIRASANVNQFILNGVPVPARIRPIRGLSSHSALRLTCNHAGYAPLWIEQLGDAWREPTPKHTWPVLDGDDARWAVRAAIDAVVADAYGLDRAQYEHVLSTFSHKSYPKAPDLCLAAFDELKGIGLEAFTKKHDPYWDIPLNESLPKPVIDLPIPGGQASAKPSLGPLFDGLGPGTEKLAAPAQSARPAPRATPAPDDGAYDTIVRLLDARGLITSGDAQQATGLDAAGVRPHLKRLVDEGRAVTEGQRRGMRYRRADG